MIGVRQSDVSVEGNKLFFRGVDGRDYFAQYPEGMPVRVFYLGLICGGKKWWLASDWTWSQEGADPLFDSLDHLLQLVDETEPPC